MIAILFVLPVIMYWCLELFQVLLEDIFALRCDSPVPVSRVWIWHPALSQNGCLERSHRRVRPLGA